MRPLAWLLPGLVVCGCSAGRGRSCAEPYSFPARFAAVQRVRIERAGQSVELLASVRRAEPNLQMVFLDPVFQRPLLELQSQDGTFRQTGALPAGSDLDARGLFGAVEQLFAATCFRRADSLELERGPYLFRLHGPDAGTVPCQLPRTIEMRLDVHPPVSVVVETLDVGCEADPGSEAE